MPDVMIKKLGPYNKENNPELICEVCRKHRNEEELNYSLMVYPHPDDETYIVDLYLNLCKVCLNDFIGNATINRVTDMLNPN